VKRSIAIEAVCGVNFEAVLVEEDVNYLRCSKNGRLEIGSRQWNGETSGTY
jgi:hypothetical protein